MPHPQIVMNTYDGTRDTFHAIFPVIAQVAFNLQELFDGINEYIEEDWCYGDYEPDKWNKVNELHDLAYKATQIAIDLKWKAVRAQDLHKEIFPLMYPEQGAEE